MSPEGTAENVAIEARSVVPSGLGFSATDPALKRRAILIQSLRDARHCYRLFHL